MTDYPPRYYLDCEGCGCITYVDDMTRTSDDVVLCHKCYEEAKLAAQEIAHD